VQSLTVPVCPTCCPTVTMLLEGLPIGNFVNKKGKPFTIITGDTKMTVGLSSRSHTLYIDGSGNHGDYQ
jgi:hypothetical protein